MRPPEPRVPPGPHEPIFSPRRMWGKAIDTEGGTGMARRVTVPEDVDYGAH